MGGSWGRGLPRQLRITRESWGPKLVFTAIYENGGRIRIHIALCYQNWKHQKFSGTVLTLTWVHRTQQSALSQTSHGLAPHSIGELAI